jgi:GT2 family glycosyltransferase
MKIHPLVQIFVLNWNGKFITEKCINSIKKINYGNYNITIVDNGSNDNSVKYLKKAFPEISIISLKNNIGFSGGSNKAFELMKKKEGKYICFISNDVEVSKNFLYYLVLKAEKDEYIGVVNPKIYFFKPKNLIWAEGAEFNGYLGRGLNTNYKRFDKIIKNKQVCKEKTSFTGCVYLIKMDILKTIKGFDERYFSYAEDTDFALRIRKKGYKIYYVPESVVWHKESFDIRNNEGMASQNYYITRNILLLMQLHGNAIHKIVFYPTFFLRYFLCMIVYYILKKDKIRALAVIEGLMDHFKKKYGKRNG